MSLAHPPWRDLVCGLRIAAFMLTVVPTLAAVWWLLTRGDLASWIVGVPAVAAASWAAVRLRPSRKSSLSLAGVARFVPLFLWESIRAGVDAARRIMAPTMRVQPGFRSYRTSLLEPSARVFFATCVNLLPGTLAAKLEGDQLLIHQLDETTDVTADLRRFERAVERLFVVRAPQELE